MYSKVTASKHSDKSTTTLSVTVKAGHLRSNPAERTTHPRAEKKEIHPLNDDLVKSFLPAAEDDEYHYMLKVILYMAPVKSQPFWYSEITHLKRLV